MRLLGPHEVELISVALKLKGTRKSFAYKSTIHQRLLLAGTLRIQISQQHKSMPNILLLFLNNNHLIGIQGWPKVGLHLYVKQFINDCVTFHRNN